MSKELNSVPLEEPTANEVALLGAFLNLNAHFVSMGDTLIAASRVVQALIDRVEKLEEKLNQ